MSRKRPYGAIRALGKRARHPVGRVFLLALAIRVAFWAAVATLGANRLGKPGADSYCYDLLGRSLANGNGFVWICRQVRPDQHPVQLHLLWHARPEGAIETVTELGDAVDFSRFRNWLCHGSGLGTVRATALPSMKAAYPAPGYPLILAAAYWLLPSAAIAAVTLLQCLIDALTAALISVAIRCYAPRAPSWLHYAWVAYLPAVTVANEVLTESFSVGLALAAVVAVLAFEARWHVLAVAAMALACAVLIRPQFVLLSVVVAAVYVARLRRRSAAALAWAVLPVLLSGAVLVSWATRNWYHFGRFAVAPSGGGLLFYSLAAPAWADWYGDGRLRTGVRELLRQYADRLFDRPRNVFDFSDQLRVCGKDWLRRHWPASIRFALKAVGRKLVGVRHIADPARRLLGEERHGRLLAFWHTWGRRGTTSITLFVALWAVVSAMTAVAVTARCALAVLLTRAFRDPIRLALLACCVLTALPVLPLANRRYVVHFLPFWIMAAGILLAPANPAHCARDNRPRKDASGDRSPGAAAGPSGGQHLGGPARRTAA